MRPPTLLIGLLFVLLLGGCAAQQAFRDGERLFDSGKEEEGLEQMDKAYRLDPGNSEYRSQYYIRRERVVFQWLSKAEAAKSHESWDEAEGLYQRILKVEPDNPRAKIGLSALKTEKTQSLELAEAKGLLEKNDLAGARKKIRMVLAGSPSHPAALMLQKAIEAQAAQASQSEQIFKSKLDRPITIEFKDAPIQAVFESISRTAGINFIFDREVRPDLTVNLFVRDARIDDVIRFVLVTNQLEQRILSKNTLFIYPATPQKQKDFQELQVKHFYLTNADAKQTASAIKEMAKSRDVLVDEKLNMIAMRDTPEVIRVAERLIAARDIAEPEVMLDVEVLEVSSSLLRDLGIRFPEQVSYSVVGAAGTPGTVTLPELINRNAGLVRVSFTNPALVLNLRNQVGDTNLLANPKIRVRNRQKAKIHIGDKVPIITNTATATVVSESVSYLDVGLKLDVEPNIHLDNEVAIDVGLEVSNIVREIRSTNGTLTYQVGTRNAATSLRLKNGETQILAGLINREDRKTSNQVPGLGQLPIVGRLFSSDSDTISKTEVVLLITPHVVRNIVRPESPVEEFSAGTESAITLERLEINSIQPDREEANAEVISSNSNAVPEIEAEHHSAGRVKLTLEAPSRVQKNGEFSVKVNMVAEGLQTALLDMSFDPTKLRVIKVEEGDLFNMSGDQPQFLHQVQDKSGRINISVTGKGNVQGGGALASVTFQSLPNVAGESQLRVGAANFSDASGLPLSIDSLPMATVEITE